jgi:hypothetical protein
VLLPAYTSLADQGKCLLLNENRPTIAGWDFHSLVWPQNPNELRQERSQGAEGQRPSLDLIQLYLRQQKLSEISIGSDEGIKQTRLGCFTGRLENRVIDLGSDFLVRHFPFRDALSITRPVLSSSSIFLAQGLVSSCLPLLTFHRRKNTLVNITSAGTWVRNYGLGLRVLVWTFPLQPRHALCLRSRLWSTRAIIATAIKTATRTGSLATSTDC